MYLAAKKIDMALERYPECDLAISGGVAANSHLRARLSEVATKRKRQFFVPDFSLCGDNAAMIAAAGYYEYERGAFADSSLNASAEDNI